MSKHNQPFQGCCPISPVPKQPQLPRLMGPPGPPGPQGIVTVVSECLSDPVDISGLIGSLATTIDLPPITVEAGQVVKLEAFAWAHVFQNPALPIFTQVRLVLSRDITIAETAQSAINDDSIPGPSLDINPSFVWLDKPEPGTYNYRLEIIATVFANDTGSIISNRALIATVINTE